MNKWNQNYLAKISAFATYFTFLTPALSILTLRQQPSSVWAGGSPGNAGGKPKPAPKGKSEPKPKSVAQEAKQASKG